MKIKLFNYNQLDTFIHKLSGSTKLICFLILTTAVMLTYDIRVIGLIFVFSCILVGVSKLPMKKIKPLLIYVFVFLIFNFILTFFVTPYYGCEVYGTKHILFHLFGRLDVTSEQLFYQVTKTMKYFSAIPVGFIFFLTTNPSEFSASLYNIKVPYKVCTTLSLTLRYFPDVERDFSDVSYAQQARGLDNSKKAKLRDRIVNTTKIIIPLIFSTLSRTETITNAMELRGYGKNKKRTWYAFRKLEVRDYISILVCTLFLLFSLFVRIYVNKSMYYNPFK